MLLSDMTCTLYYVCLFFFFKQKTAYEMRISDWSSDVCSSDLKFIVRDATTENNVWWDQNKSMTSEAFDLLHADMLKHAEGKELFIQEIGRASCRERVCQYV